MSDLGSQLNQLSPEQRQAVLARAQQEANQAVMQGQPKRCVAILRPSIPLVQLYLILFFASQSLPTEMMKRMVAACYDKCAGTSVSRSPGTTTLGW